MSEGIVDDPFLGTSNLYALWRSPNLQNWIWIDLNTDQVVYMQTWRVDLKKNLVFQVQNGLLSWSYLSAYNFQIWKCMTF
jgi:hypothetical protein